MNRIFISAIAVLLCSIAFAQPMGMHLPPSTYDQVDEVRKKLNLDQSQFEKMYSVYEKYNKAVFGDLSAGMQMPAPPSGGRPGGPGFPPGGPRPGGGPGFGDGKAGNHPDFNGPRPGRPGANGLNENGPSAEEIQKMEKTRTKQEEKLVKSIQKIFKKDPSAFEKWQSIRSEQLKRMFERPPLPEKTHE